MSNKDNQPSNKIRISDELNKKRMNKQAEQQGLLEDEAFIQSIYNEIGGEIEEEKKGSVTKASLADKSHNDFFAEQPNAMNDDKILAAARRAVSSSPQPVVKKRSWAIPVTSAASLVLVFSLFLNQLTPQLTPHFTAPSTEAELTGSVQTDEVHMSEAPIEDLTKYYAQRAPTGLAKSSTDNFSAKQFKSYELSGDEFNTEIVSQSEIDNQANISLQQQRDAEQRYKSRHELQAKAKLKGESGRQIEAMSVVTSPADQSLVRSAANFTAKILTKDDYLEFLRNKNEWSFVDQTDIFYRVKVYNQEKYLGLYQLPKTAYYIFPFNEEKLIKRPLEQILLEKP